MPVLERLGPAYTTGQLRRLLPGTDAAPVSDERVRQRRAAGGLVGLKTRDGAWVFPAWQFRLRPRRVEPRADVLALWRNLPHGETFDDWSLALWLTGRRLDLDDLTPLAWLAEHGHDERLQRAVLRPAALANAHSSPAKSSSLGLRTPWSPSSTRVNSASEASPARSCRSTLLTSSKTVTRSSSSRRADGAGAMRARSLKDGQCGVEGLG